MVYLLPVEWTNPVWIIAILAILGAFYKVIHWKINVDNNQTNLKKSFDDDRSTLLAFIKEIRTDIKKIFERLPSPTLSENSPLQLNNLGQSISERLGGRTWAEQAAKQLVDTVKGKSPYEIQSQCFDFVEQAQLEPSMRKAVLDCAYENGLSDDQVLDVLAIELRNVLLSLTGHGPEDIPDKR